MARRRRLDSYTDETRTERRARRFAELAQLRERAIERLVEPSGWAAFLEAHLRLGLGWRNCALVAFQRPGAVALGTYSQWRSHGLQVQKGERSFRITASASKGFRSVAVFDVLQTDASPEWLVDAGLAVDVDGEVGELMQRFPVPTTVEEASERAEAVVAEAQERTAA
jgi:hypothetical protein